MMLSASHLQKRLLLTSLCDFPTLQRRTIWTAFVTLACLGECEGRAGEYLAAGHHVRQPRIICKTMNSLEADSLLKDSICRLFIIIIVIIIIIITIIIIIIIIIIISIIKVIIVFSDLSVLFENGMFFIRFLKDLRPFVAF